MTYRIIALNDRRHPGDRRLDRRRVAEMPVFTTGSGGGNPAVTLTTTVAGKV